MLRFEVAADIRPHNMVRRLLFGRRCIFVAAGAFVWPQVILFGRRCFALASCTYVWPQVLLFDLSCFCLAAGAFARPHVLWFGRRCFWLAGNGEEGVGGSRARALSITFP